MYYKGLYLHLEIEVSRSIEKQKTKQTDSAAPLNTCKNYAYMYYNVNNTLWSVQKKTEAQTKRLSVFIYIE